MVNGDSTNLYAEKIGEVCDYINAHLNEDLSVEKLSQVAHFSKFHFHRQFSEYTGINVAKFVLMLRLKRTSYQLVFNKDYRIIDISLDACFESPEPFFPGFFHYSNFFPEVAEHELITDIYLPLI